MRTSVCIYSNFLSKHYLYLARDNFSYILCIQWHSKQFFQVLYRIRKSVQKVASLRSWRLSFTFSMQSSHVCHICHILLSEISCKSHLKQVIIKISNKIVFYVFFFFCKTGYHLFSPQILVTFPRRKPLAKQGHFRAPKRRLMKLSQMSEYISVSSTVPLPGKQPFLLRISLWFGKLHYI